jgi:hypothetical protein
MNIAEAIQSERLAGAARADRVRKGHVHRGQARAGDIQGGAHATNQGGGRGDVQVQVESVQVANVGGKVKRFGRFTGRRRSWKKAYVCLKPGQEINFAAES